MYPDLCSHLSCQGNIVLVVVTTIPFQVPCYNRKPSENFESKRNLMNWVDYYYSTVYVGLISRISPFSKSIRRKILLQ